jgi:hypothetical protein
MDVKQLTWMHETSVQGDTRTMVISILLASKSGRRSWWRSDGPIRTLRAEGDLAADGRRRGELLQVAELDSPDCPDQPLTCSPHHVARTR